MNSQRRKAVERLVDCGISVGSADNSQPFKLAYDDERIVVSRDTRHEEMIVDPNWSTSELSIGSFVEAMKLKAPELGLELSTTKIAGHPQQRVELQVDTGPKNPHELAPAIERRWTNRWAFDLSQPVDIASLQYLEDSVKDIGGARVHWFQKGDPDRVRFDEAIMDTDRVRYLNVRVLRDLAKMVASPWHPTPDGLAWNELGVNPYVIGLPFSLSPWQALYAVNKFPPALKLSVALSAGIPLKSAEYTFALTMNDDSPFEWGRAIFRIWVAAALKGLAFQPLDVIPIFLLRLEHELAAYDAAQSFSAAQVKVISTAGATVNGLINKVNEQPGRLVFIGRVGTPQRGMMTRTGQLRRYPREHFVQSSLLDT